MPNVILPPYSSIPLPQYMRDEFARRSDTYGLHYTENPTNINTYRGQQTSWVRAVANVSLNKKEGFILRGINGFKDCYGLGNTVSVDGIKTANVSILGYDRNGVPHTLKNDTTIQKFRPCPGIESVEIDIRQNVYRAAFIKWKCYSVDQLNYMSDYMFTPYSTVILEWGWNTYNPSSLIDITDLGTAARFKHSNPSQILNNGSGILGAFTNPLLIEDKIKDSRGKYDGMIGHIINFDFTFNPSEMCFNCTTELASNSKFYFGLAFDKITNDIKREENASKVTLREMFNGDILEELKNQARAGYKSSTPITPNRFFKTQVNGRVFVPSYYMTYVLNQPPHKHADDLYVSFGLFADIINEKIAGSAQKTPQFKLDIRESRVGAHPNIISCSENYLLPNAVAPYFGAQSFVGGTIDPSDNPIHQPTTSPTTNTSADILMRTVLKSNKRQDLNAIINYLRTTEIKSTISIPRLDDPPNSLYYGNLADVYLNYNFLNNLLSTQKTLMDVLNAICASLNFSCPIWKLRVIVGGTSDTITIRDDNFTDIKHLNSLKAELGILVNEPIIYHFDAYSQESFLREFTVGVKLSDTVANQVLYQTNAQLGGNTDTKPVLNQRSLFNNVSDYILNSLVTKPTSPQGPYNNGRFDADGLPIRDINATTTPKRVNDIDENSLIIQQGKNVTRLRIPEGEKGKLLELLEDTENALFTNISGTPIPGVKVEFNLLGIAGFKTFQVFGVKNMPKPYDTGVLFQVTEIKHSITPEGWTTRVTSVIRPVKSLQTILI